jgi:3',5'-cyclic-AMP phosphodiesterase
MIEAAPIKILQLSDLHLFAKIERSLAGIQTHATLAAVVEKMQHHCRKFIPDLLAVTGDISQDNTLESYQHAYKFLKDFPCPMTAIPGNHENIDYFFSFFLKAMRAEKKIIFGNWQLLFLNSHLPGKVAGLLSASELDFLADSLQNSDDKFTIIFIHHHVLPVGCRWLDNINLANSEEFLQIINAHQNIKAVVSGHVHQEHEQTRKGANFITTPSACFQFARNSEQFRLDTAMPGFRCFSLYADGKFDSEVIRIDDTTQFIPDLTVKSY